MQPGVLRYRTSSTGFRVVDVDGAGNPVLYADDAFNFADPVDITKRMRFDVGSVSAAALRVWTVPDFSIDFSGFWISTGTATDAMFRDDRFLLCDPAATTKRGRLDMGLVTAGQTRVFSMPDIDYSPQVSTAPITTADPGTGNAIPVDKSTSIVLTTGTGAETNTIAVPTAVGQQISLFLGTAGGGTRTITASQAINQTGNTKMAFTQASDWILLRAVEIAGSALRWRVAANDGVTLS